MTRIVQSRAQTKATNPKNKKLRQKYLISYQLIQFLNFFFILIFFHYTSLKMDEESVDKKICQAVALVSSSQIYQKKVFIFLCLIWTQVALYDLITSMVFTNPLLYCNQQQSSQANYCQHILQHPQNCNYQNKFTGTYYAGLYCQNREQRMTLQSIFAFGAILGIIIIPGLSDIKGKYMSTNISLYCCLGGCLCILWGIFYKVYNAIGVGLFVSAFGTNALMAITYSINSDFFSDDMRQKAIIYYCAAWGLTYMLIIVVYYVIPHWWFFLIFLIFLPMLGLFIYFKTFFLESPHYLINAKSDYQGARKIITKLSQINQSDEQCLHKSLQTITKIQERRRTSATIKLQPSQLTAKQAIKIILRSPKYLKAMICLILIKMGFYSFYYGVLGCLERTGFNFGVSVFLMGLGEFTGHSSGTVFIPKLKRRSVLAVTNILVSIIGLAYITKTVQESPLLASFILYLCVFLLSCSFSALTLVQTQSFSSTIRSTALGIEYGVSYMVRLGLPFMIGYLNQKGMHPIIAISVIMVFIGILPIVFLEQTFGYSNLQNQQLLDQTYQYTQLKVIVKKSPTQKY